MMRQFISFLALFFCTTVFANPAPSPIGYWKTVDDVTGKVKSIVNISQKNNLLFGKVIKIYPSPGFDEHEICTACEGVKHNQPIVGMTILTGLQQDKKNPLEWHQGKILDPKNGKIYRCQLSVIDKGEKLAVRGYIGIAMFGRSQVWEKINWKDENLTV